MGITECKRHGQRAIVPLCRHLLESIESGIKPERILSVHSYFGDFFGDREKPMFLGFLYCAECVKEKSFPEESAALTNEEYESLQLNGIMGICEECLEEALEKHKIDWSEIDPQSN